MSRCFQIVYRWTIYLCGSAYEFWGFHSWRTLCRNRGKGTGTAFRPCAHEYDSLVYTWLWKVGRFGSSPARNRRDWCIRGHRRVPLWCAWRSRAWNWTTCCTSSSDWADRRRSTCRTALVWWGDACSGRRLPIRRERAPRPGRPPGPPGERDAPRGGEPWASWRPSGWRWPCGTGWPPPRPPSFPRRCGTARANTFPSADAFAGGSWPPAGGGACGGGGGGLQVLSRGTGRGRRDAKRCRPRRRPPPRVRPPARPPRSTRGTCASDDAGPNGRPTTTWRPVAAGNRAPRRSRRAAAAAGRAGRADGAKPGTPIG